MKNTGTGSGGLFIAIAAASLLAACVPATQVKHPNDTSATGLASDPLPPTGYRRVMKNGTEYFCSRETYTGSRTQTFERCLTKAQIAALSDSGQDFLRRQQNHVGEQPMEANPGGAPYSAAQPLP